MYKYLKDVDKQTKAKIDENNCSWMDYEHFKSQIDWLQHERQIHLFVLLFTGALFFILATIAFIFLNIVTGFLFVISMALSICYLVHYARLENMAQSWYKLSDKMMNQERISCDNLADLKRK